jgi:hypothetical protein
VLSKSRCPYTGVVNFFAETDPLLAVGSVAEVGLPGRYVWWCYMGDEACGLAGDMSLAEARLRHALASSRAQRVAGKHRNAEPAQQSRSARHWQKLNESGYWRS